MAYRSVPLTGMQESERHPEVTRALYDAVGLSQTIRQHPQV